VTVTSRKRRQRGHATVTALLHSSRRRSPVADRSGFSFFFSFFFIWRAPHRNLTDRPHHQATLYINITQQAMLCHQMRRIGSCSPVRLPSSILPQLDLRRIRTSNSVAFVQLSAPRKSARIRIGAPIRTGHGQPTDQALRVTTTKTCQTVGSYISSGPDLSCWLPPSPPFSCSDRQPRRYIAPIQP
jgi:hypothetical protein